MYIYVIISEKDDYFKTGAGAEDFKVVSFYGLNEVLHQVDIPVIGLCGWRPCRSNAG